MLIAARFVAFVPIVGLILTTTASPLRAAAMRFRPVAATGNVICLPGEGSCGDTEIILSDGGVSVTLFLEFGGWDRIREGWLLGSLQAALRATSLTSPWGYDLVPVGHPDMGFEGAFQSLKVCGDIFNPSDFDPLAPCATIADCPSGDYCINRPDYVFYGLDNTAVVSTATPNYTWSMASYDCAVDPDGETMFYFGTLLLGVPTGARGTYNVRFVDDSNYTLWQLCVPGLVPGQYLTPGQITVMPGATDCNDNGIPDEFELESGDCDDNGILDDCELDADRDGDGTIDECDGCPDDPRKVEPGFCGCGVDDDADRDGDGTPDCVDQCPDDANKIEPGVCGCGLDEDTDSDGDGIADCYDECPGIDDRIFAPECVDQIPTVSTWGLAILALLLLVSAKVYFGRRVPLGARCQCTDAKARAGEPPVAPDQ